MISHILPLFREEYDSFILLSEKEKKEFLWRIGKAVGLPLALTLPPSLRRCRKHKEHRNERAPNREQLIDLGLAPWLYLPQTIPAKRSPGEAGQRHRCRDWQNQPRRSAWTTCPTLMPGVQRWRARAACPGALPSWSWTSTARRRAGGRRNTCRPRRSSPSRDATLRAGEASTGYRRPETKSDEARRRAREGAMGQRLR